MNNKDTNVYERIVKALCLSILCGILIAGLWPFHVYNNDVNWLENENGLHFGGYGSIVSTGVFSANPAKGGLSCSLEMWLATDDIDQSNTVLAFDSSPDPTEPFSVAQDHGDLLIKHPVIDEQGNVRRQILKIAGAFRKGVPTVVTITAGQRGTIVYVDAVPAKVSPRSAMSSKDLTGRLIVANSTTNDSWSGRFFGLAIYHRQLTPAEVAKHYETWTKNQGPDMANSMAPAALYLFNERNGAVVHNQIDPAPDLTIPMRYQVLHPQLLQPAWREYRLGWPGWSYWKDVAINIAGFIPAGFCFLTYFSSVRRIKRPAATVLLLGFLLSLAIETSQRFLPTRDSDMTDVITNTLGTAIGVLAGRWSSAQGMFTKASAYAVCFVENLSRGKADARTEQAEKIETSA